MCQELNAKVTRLQSTLQRINAPNMKALEKLVVSVWKHVSSDAAFVCVCVCVCVCVHAG